MDRNDGNDSRKATAVATVAKAVESGRTALGVEFGSTRIKAVLIGEDHKPVASGSHEWENRFEHGVWTYHIEDVWTGLQDSYRKLSDEVFERYGVRLNAVGAIGVSAMMHGYLAFDRDDNLLTPFRTWRNTSTGQAAEKLTALFGFNIPQRWSIAHLYQAILNREPHVADIRYLTTLAGYVHWKLTGQKVLGVGEASGMFPIDSTTNTGAALPREHSSLRGRQEPSGRSRAYTGAALPEEHSSRGRRTKGRQEPDGGSRAYSYDERMVQLFNRQPDVKELPWKLQHILPKVLVAGDTAGVLTEVGAALIDPTGQLLAGIPLCPPEGDAGTGMVATNSVRERTGNVSAGTSVFAMIVMEKALSKLYPEIDMVTTPAGKPVAMVHSNNCTSDLNAWAGLFSEFSRALGVEISQSQLFELLYKQALTGDADGGGMLAFNYLSGEHITHFEEGRPLFVRTPESRFTLANFMRVHLFSALGALKIGMDILFEQEKVQLDQVLAHGGFFKTPEVGQRIMAAALNVPVSVMETAGEGGAWGSALLAAYMFHKGADEPLEEYLSNRVFAEEISTTVAPSEADVEGYRAFMERYQRGLVIERSAVEALK